MCTCVCTCVYMCICVCVCVCVCVCACEGLIGRNEFRNQSTVINAIINQSLFERIFRYNMFPMARDSVSSIN